METLTGSHIVARRWVRFLGTGATALLAVGTVASTAGAATTNAPIGATGSVAALSSSSMEVQNPSSGQTTVNWTATTQFSKSATESVSAITVGDCVTATGSASKKSKTTIAARSITVITPSSSGTCNAAGRAGSFGVRAPGGGTGSGGPPAGGFFRTGGGGSGGTRPSFPKGAPSGNFGGQLANLDIASGKVTAVSGSTLTISGISISPGSLPPRTKASSKNTKSSSKNNKPPTPKTETLKITTSSSTPVSTTQTVTSSALAVGDCVSAFGPAASNGSVTATNVRITSTDGGSCTEAVGGGAFFGGGAPGGGGGGAQ